MDPNDGTVVVQRGCASNYAKNAKYMRGARAVLKNKLKAGYGYNCHQNEFSGFTVCTCTSDLCNYQVHSAVIFREEGGGMGNPPFSKNVKKIVVIMTIKIMSL